MAQVISKFSTTARQLSVSFSHQCMNYLITGAHSSWTPALAKSILTILSSVVKSWPWPYDLRPWPYGLRTWPWPYKLSPWSGLIGLGPIDWGFASLKPCLCLFLLTGSLKSIRFKLSFNLQQLSTGLLTDSWQTTYNTSTCWSSTPMKHHWMMQLIKMSQYKDLCRLFDRLFSSAATSAPV